MKHKLDSIQGSDFTLSSQNILQDKGISSCGKDCFDFCFMNDMILFSKGGLFKWVYVSYITYANRTDVYVIAIIKYTYVITITYIHVKKFNLWDGKMVQLLKATTQSWVAEVKLEHTCKCRCGMHWQSLCLRDR